MRETSHCGTVCSALKHFSHTHQSLNDNEFKQTVIGKQV